MFTDKQLERHADVLWWGLSTARRSPFKKDDIVLLRYIERRSSWLKFYMPDCLPEAIIPSSA